jgi:two-component system chemotaxis response regulator CheB
LKDEAHPPVGVLVVDDSPTVQQFLCWMVERAGFIVTGTAASVDEAEEIVHRRKPDLVLSDVRLQDGDGIELTQRVLAKRGVPIILITAHDPTNPDLVFRALEAGALDVLAKPPAMTAPGFEAYRRSFEATLRSLAGTPIVRRNPKRVPISADKVPPPDPRRSTVGLPNFAGPPVIAIAASTGGPLLVGDILKALPADAFAFALVVQHIVPEFADSFRVWLGEYSGRRVTPAEGGRAPIPGGIYTSPPNCHIQLQRDGLFRTSSAKFLPSPHVPSADAMFESLAEARPADVLAVQLSGMGTDGADGLARLRAAGGYTIVQSPDTAVVDGMPRSAIERGAATAVLRPDEIVRVLRSLPVGARRL